MDVERRFERLELLLFATQNSTTSKTELNLMERVSNLKSKFQQLSQGSRALGELLVRLDRHQSLTRPNDASASNGEADETWVRQWLLLLSSNNRIRQHALSGDEDSESSNVDEADADGETRQANRFLSQIQQAHHLLHAIQQHAQYSEVIKFSASDSGHHDLTQKDRQLFEQAVASQIELSQRVQRLYDRVSVLVETHLKWTVTMNDLFIQAYHNAATH